MYFMLRAKLETSAFLLAKLGTFRNCLSFCTCPNFCQEFSFRNFSRCLLSFWIKFIRRLTLYMLVVETKFAQKHARLNIKNINFNFLAFHENLKKHIFGTLKQMSRPRKECLPTNSHDRYLGELNYSTNTIRTQNIKRGNSLASIS